MGRHLLLLLGAIALAALQGAPALPPRGAAPRWRTLEQGLEMGELRSPRQSPAGDSRIRVLRIDPHRFALRLLNSSAPGQGQPLSAREWAERHRLVAAINASMYGADQRTSLGLMRTRAHVNNPRLTRDKAVLAFDPLEPGLPPVKLIDRDCDDLDRWKGRYGTLIQSIRMISCDGRNVWAQQKQQRWSIAAIGVDRRGRVLFLHVRSPYSPHDLIDVLRALPLDLAGAMYAEGGPEAQLYVNSGGTEVELVGSHGAGLFQSEDNDHAWPVPNVIGVVRR